MSRDAEPPALTPLRFVVPMPENIANGKQKGFFGVARRKKQYFATLDAMQGAGLLPSPPRRPFARATIRATMYLGASMDEGNALHRCEKWPCDWLKTRGYLVDDRRSCLTWEGMPAQVVKRDGQYRIELTVSPLA